MHTILSLCLVLANSYILNKETLKYNQQLCTVFLCSLLLCSSTFEWQKHFSQGHPLHNHNLGQQGNAGKGMNLFYFKKLWKQIPILSNSKIILWTFWKFQKLWKRIPSSSSSSRGTRTPSLPRISAQMGNRWNRTCFFVSSKRSTTALRSRRSLSKWVTYSFVRWFHLHWTTVSCSGNFSLQTQRHTGVLLCYLTPFSEFRIFEPFAAGTLGTLDQSWTFSFLGQEAWLLLRREIPQWGFGWRTWKATQQS